MSGLKALLNKQKQVEVSDGEDKAVAMREAPGVEPVSTQAPEEKPKTAIGLRFGTKPATARPDSVRTDDVESARQEPASVPAVASELDDFESGIADIGRGSSTPSGFADETPATAPLRALDGMGELDDSAKGFINLIDGVYEIYHDADLMGNVIRSIMVELKSNPQYINAQEWKKSLVQPDDIRLWIRGMRDSMGLAKMKKAESKAKRSGGKTAKSKAVDDDMLSDLASLGIDI